MDATASTSSTTLSIGAIAAATLLLVLTAFVSVLTVVIEANTCGATNPQSDPSAQAEHGIPANYLALYRDAGRQYGVPWQVLAGIGSIETDHGRLRAPGVRSGVNSFGCCAGPMQFNTRDGPPSTWDRYAVDGNHDGTKDIYDPADAIPSAANYLRELLRRADGNLSQAILGYNHSQAYVNDVLARARRYADQTIDELATTDAAVGCSGGGLDVPVGPANLRTSRAAHRAARLPRRCRRGRWPPAAPPSSSTPASTATSSGSCAATTCTSPPPAKAATRPTATAPPSTSSPPTAPPNPSGTPPPDASPKTSAGQPAARRSGTRPACPLVPAIQFIGYDGYPSHGSPRTCTGTCPAHLHISWASGCYGSSTLSPPCAWVAAFPQPPDGGAAASAAQR